MDLLVCAFLLYARFLKYNWRNFSVYGVHYLQCDNNRIIISHNINGNQINLNVAENIL